VVPSSRSCHSTKSLRDSGAVRLGLSAVRRGALVGSAFLEDRAVGGVIKLTAPRLIETHDGPPLTSKIPARLVMSTVVTWDRTTMILTRASKESRLDNRDPRSGYGIRKLYAVAQMPSESLSRRSCSMCCRWPAKSLKYLMGQNVKSPFSNIRAETFKLHLCSSQIADANRWKHSPGTKSP
jgi:hypothetical protein